ncbi:MAG: hypothetical protein OEV36_08170, partial [Myxococcales bacterium]|nr:hypothetical protein [Myxococcales bacterium]
MIDRMQAESAVTAPSAIARQDLSGFTNALVRVRPTGAVELVLHAKGSVGDTEAADVRALGGEIVATLKTPGLIQVWIPVEQIGEAAALPW